MACGGDTVLVCGQKEKIKVGGSQTLIAEGYTGRNRGVEILLSEQRYLQSNYDI